MRLCRSLLCDEAATVWYRGPWCSRHALRFGDAPAREAGDGRAPARPQGTFLRRSRPVGRASTSTSAGVSEPAFTETELLDTLATHGLLDPIDLELELMSRLGEF